MAEIQITGLSALQQRISATVQQAPRLVGQVLTRRLTEAVAYAKTTYLTGGTTSTRLGVRTGALRASFGMQVQQGGEGISARIGYILPQVSQGDGNPLVYARIHEGWPTHRPSTTIRPRRGQYLAVPLPGAKTPAGVARGRPRDFPHTFIQRSQQGNLLIFQQQGKNIVPLFVLVREVTIPARPALRPTMQRFTPLVLADIGTAITAHLGG